MWPTENPRVFSHFERVSGYLDSENEKYLWDDSVETIFAVKHYSSLLLSALCVFLNSLLVLFLATNKGFRDMKFFPLALQAVVDIIGPGVANCVFEVRSYQKTMDILRLSASRGDSTSLRALKNFATVIGGDTGCLLALLRMVLNEYATG